MQGRSSEEERGDEGRHQEEEEQRFPAGAGEGVPSADHSLPLLASLGTFSRFNWGLSTVAACRPDTALSWYGSSPRLLKQQAHCEGENVKTENSLYVGLRAMCAKQNTRHFAYLI